MDFPFQLFWVLHNRPGKQYHSIMQSLQIFLFISCFQNYNLWCPIKYVNGLWNILQRRSFIMPCSRSHRVVYILENKNLEHLWANWFMALILCNFTQVYPTLLHKSIRYLFYILISICSSLEEAMSCDDWIFSVETSCIWSQPWFHIIS